MSKPKLQAIVEDFQTRLKAIDGTDPFYTNIGINATRGQRSFNETELPICTVFLTPITRGEAQRERVITEGAITIHARHGYSTEIPEDIGIQMAADIQMAIETTDRTIGGLLRDDFQWLRDEIFYPHPNQLVIAVEVQYSIPTIRHWGNPKEPI